MARKFFRKWIPHPHLAAGDQRFRRLGKLLHQPNLWHLNRHSASRGLAVGTFWGFVPLPAGQSLFAVATAVRCRGHVGLAFLATWFSNPFTLAPYVYISYQIGRFILRQPPVEDFEPTLAWLRENFPNIWLPFGIGSLVFSVLSGLLAYFLVQHLWKWNTARRWHRRSKLRSHHAATLLQAVPPVPAQAPGRPLPPPPRQDDLPAQPLAH